MKATDFRQAMKLVVSVVVLTLCIVSIARSQQASPVVPPLVNSVGGQMKSVTQQVETHAKQNLRAVWKGESHAL
jgi:hypothetical protein